MSFGEIISFEPLGDERGSLVAIESNKNVPFDIKRVYYIFGTAEGVSRGFHAHRDLQQVAVCVTGSCRFVLHDGKQRKEIVLDKSTRGLLIEALTWREMHDFSSDCVLVVLASEHYDKCDYILDFDEFLKEVNL